MTKVIARDRAKRQMGETYKLIESALHYTVSPTTAYNEHSEIQRSVSGVQNMVLLYNCRYFDEHCYTKISYA